MRKLLIILTLFGLMLALLAFEQTETSAPFQPKVLAALGFILLSAYTLGEGVRRLGLPQLLGYILSGVLFGPHLSALIFGDSAKALFNSAVVEELALINLMAQGLIGLAAGGELKASELRSSARAIGWVLALQTLLVLGATGGGVYLVGRLAPGAVGFLTSHAALIAAALLFGTLAVGTSPAATLAVLTETKARGPLSSLTLGVIVSKDVTTVTLYLLALSLAQPLASGKAVEWATIQQIGVELGGAMLLGPFLGTVIIAYLKWIRAELMLFTVVLVFVGQWLAQLLHAEVLLSFIVAGFFVENFSAQGEKMIKELKRLSQPVFVVFFTIAAAKLKLGALREFWLVVLVYALTRGVMLFWATRWGTQIARSASEVQRWLPWNFIAQSGVTLTLAGLTRGRVPWADEFQTIIMATISVHVVIGPTVLKWVLQRAGEVPPDPDAAPPPPSPVVGEPAGASAGVSGEPEDEASWGLAPPAFGAMGLDEPLERLRLRVEGLASEARATLLRPRHEAERALLRQAAEVAQEALQEAQERAESWLDEEPRERARSALQRARQEWLDEVFEVVRRESEASSLEPLERGIEAFLAQVEEAIREAPESVVVPQDPARFQVLGGERRAVRWLKRGKRLLRPLGFLRARVVPLRVVLRFAFSLPLVGHLSEAMLALGALRLHTWGLLGELWLKTDARLGDLQRALETDGEGGARALALLRDEREALRLRIEAAQVAQGERIAEVERGLQRGLSRAWAGVLEASSVAGTWEWVGQTSAKRFEDHQRQKQALGLGLRAAEQRSLGAAGALWLELEVKRIEQRLAEVSQRSQGQIERELLSRVCAHTLALRGQVEAARSRLARALVPGATPSAALRALARERDEFLSALHDDALAELQRLRDERLTSAPLEEVLVELRRAMEAASVTLRMARQGPALPAEGHGLPHEAALYEVPLRALLLQVLEQEVKVHLSNLELRLSNLVERATVELGEVGRALASRLESSAQEVEDAEEGGEDEEPQVGRRRPQRRGRRARLGRDGALTAAGVALPAELALGALDGAGERLEELHAAILDEGAELQRALLQETRKPLQQLHAQAASDSAELRRRVAQLGGAVALAQPPPSPALQRARAWLGPRGGGGALADEAPLAVRLSAQVAQATREVWAREDVPEIYRRLFSPAPTELVDFFVPRPEAVALFQDAARRWMAGSPTAVAVLGEAGAGITSFLNHVLQAHLSGVPVLRRNLTRTVLDEGALLEELEPGAGARDPSLRLLLLRLKHRGERCVIVLEDAEKLFLKTVEGVEALRGLLAVVGESGREVLWVWSLGPQAWAWLQTVVQIGDHFTHPISLRPLSLAEMEGVILARHRVSGYKLVFDPALDEVGPWARAARRLGVGEDADDPQARRRRRYFEQLHAASRGNPTLAIAGWLGSVSLTSALGDTLLVKPVAPAPLGLLERLDAERLLALAALLVHQGLTTEEFAQVMRCSEDAARAALGPLIQSGIVQGEAESDQPWRVHPLLQRPIVELLQARKIF